MKRLRGFAAHVLLLTILPLFLALSAVALGSVIIHQNSMREMVGDRDLRAVRTAALALSDPTLMQNDQRMHQLLAGLEMNPQTTVMLMDRSGRLVYQTNAVCGDSCLSRPGVAEALAGQSGTLYRADYPGGQEYVISFAPVLAGSSNSPPTYALIVEEPWSQVASSWLGTSLVAPLLLVPAVALALVAIWLGVQRVIRPLQRLDAQVTALGWGDFDAVKTSVGGIAEVQELQKTLAQMAAQTHAYQQSMHGYLSAVTEAQEDERKRLARELHDDTVQSLIALKQRVQLARRKVPQGPTFDAMLSELQEMLETTMSDVRRFSRALRPIYLEEAGLVAALETLARDASHTELHIAFEVTGEVRRLAPEVELALYRIVQESLTNVAKHAHASSAHVSVAFNSSTLSIRVEDNGVGFDAPERATGLVVAGHYGLMGMQERAQLVGAKLALRSQPGKGTQVEVQTPF